MFKNIDDPATCLICGKEIGGKDTCSMVEMIHTRKAGMIHTRKAGKTLYCFVHPECNDTLFERVDFERDILAFGTSELDKLFPAEEKVL